MKNINIWLTNNCISILIISILIIGWSTTLIYFLFFQQNKLIFTSPVGTYLTGEYQDSEYFVFDQDNSFYHYRLRQPLASGSYVYHDTILTIQYNNINNQLILNNNLLYYYNESEFKIYNKISEIPTFIDVSFD